MLAMSLASNTILGRSRQQAARVWDLTAEDSGVNPRVLAGHQDEIWSEAISPDSHWLVSGSDTVRVWDLTAENPGTNRRVLSGHQAGITSVAISPDNHWLVTGSVDGKLSVWRWQWDDLVTLASSVGRNFTRDEWASHFPGVPYRRTFPDLPIPGDSQ